MEGKRLPPLLNLSRLKAAAAKGTGPGIATGAPATWGEDATSSSCICARGATGATTTSGPSTTTLFDARRELAADLQRREARRAQARAEAADTEGEASVLAALRAVHRLLRDAGEKKRERARVFGNWSDAILFFRLLPAPVAGSNPDSKSAARPRSDSLFWHSRGAANERRHRRSLWDCLFRITNEPLLRGRPKAPKTSCGRKKRRLRFSVAPRLSCAHLDLLPLLFSSPSQKNTQPPPTRVPSPPPCRSRPRTRSVRRSLMF